MIKFTHIFILQAVGLVWAPLWFMLISEKNIAATIAGFGFVIVSASSAGYYFFQKSNKLFNTLMYGCWTLFLAFISVPQLWMRISNWELNSINHLKIYGLPFYLFHQFSSYIYGALFLASLCRLIKNKMFSSAR